MRWWQAFNGEENDFCGGKYKTIINRAGHWIRTTPSRATGTIRQSSEGRNSEVRGAEGWYSAVV